MCKDTMINLCVGYNMVIQGVPVIWKTQVEMDFYQKYHSYREIRIKYAYRDFCSMILHNKRSRLQIFMGL